MRVLAADIGGSNTRVQILDGSGLVETLRIPTSGPSLALALKPYESSFVGLSGAVLAIAGPVQAQKAKLTNFAWDLDAQKLSHALGCPVRLVNDFEAAALGVSVLPESATEHLSGPSPDPIGLAVVLGPGTGLGQALLLPGHPRRVHPTEGGHVDLAPNSPTQAKIWEWLHEQHGHVSAERVLSGAGLLALQHFFAEELNQPKLASPAAVSSSETRSARAALTHFVQFLGAHAGNVALALNPPGGVWIAGGIAPRLPLKALGLLEAFHNKGRLSPACAQVPLMLVLDSDLGLMGAAALARRLYGEV
jgi:glucokinase